MSDWDEDTGEYDTLDDEPGGPSGVVIGVLAVLLVVLLVALAFVLLRNNAAEEPSESLTADPLPTATTPEGTPTDEATAPPEPTPTPEPTPEPTPTPTPEPTEREPGDVDAAAFASAYTPPDAETVESVTVDVNGDERKEIVFASIVGDVVRLDVAAWTGTGYEIVFTGQGGSAAQIDDFYVSDLTGDDTREIAVQASSGSEGESVSVWGWDADADEYTPLPAEGGCWDGSHVYGVIGASVAQGQIVATCDGAPEPQELWPSDVYEWDGEAWVYVETREP